VTDPGNCLRAVVPKIKADVRGAIVNMASTMSKLAIEDRFAYGRSKGAVLTRSCLVSSLFV
jgi:short-subunit dehydrogenase